MLIGNNFKFMFAIIHCRSSSNKFNFEIRMAHLGSFSSVSREEKKKLWEVHILFWGCIAIHPSSIHRSWGRMISRCVFSALVEEDVGSFGLKKKKNKTKLVSRKKKLLCKQTYHNGVFTNGSNTWIVEMVPSSVFFIFGVSSVYKIKIWLDF